MQSSKVIFAVAGGYAVALHGAVRGTVDIDLCVAVDRENLARAEAALLNLGLVSRLPVTSKEISQFRREYIQTKNLIAWSFIDPKNPARVVDILIHHNLKESEIKRFVIHGRKVPVIARSVLIKMKTQSGRPQDLEDVRALKELSEKS